MGSGSTGLAGHLEKLARQAAELDVPAPVPEELVEHAGRPQRLAAAAQLWRDAATAVEQAAGDVRSWLAGIDSAWEGQAADAFVDHLQQYGTSGTDLADSLRALADALQHTADGVLTVLADFDELAAETAESVDRALDAGNAELARQQLANLADPGNNAVDSLTGIYRTLSEFCRDLANEHEPAPPTASAQPTGSAAPASGVEPAAASPSGGAEPSSAGAGAPAPGTGEVAASVPGTGRSAEGNVESPLPPGGSTAAGEVPQPPAAAPAAAAGTAAAGTVGGMYGMPMGMMGAGMAPQGAQERRNASRLKSDPKELFGAPQEGNQAVLGEPDVEAEDEISDSDWAAIGDGDGDIPDLLADGTLEPRDKPGS